MRRIFGWLTLKNLKFGPRSWPWSACRSWLPIRVVSWIVVQRSAADAAAARKELEGVEQARPLRALLHDVVRHLGLAARTLHGAGSARGACRRRRRRRTPTRPR